MMLNIKNLKPKKKNFSSFNLASAYKQLRIKFLLPWILDSDGLEPSDFFVERINRLKRNFDLRSYEESKKLSIDAFCEEVMEKTVKLKIWKGGKLESDVLVGNADYVIAERQDYLETPFLCIVEAKKDDFEQGLAQCLVEMQACQWKNQQVEKNIDVFGIVTNGQGWIFYKLSRSDEVMETGLYSSDETSKLLGAIYYVFQECEKNLMFSKS
jgi:flagellar biosynthesis regulator FlbT